VHISYLQTAEALQLIEQPVKDFTLLYEKTASQRVLEITRCHPALTQLMCAEIVSLKNKQDINERRIATVNDVEAAVSGALQCGRFFFADISNNQVSKNGLAILNNLAAQGEGKVISFEIIQEKFPDESAITNLLQRELIESTETGYRFQIELIRRWFVLSK
ncbi:MAG: hypothetical protein KAG43_09010, partial [Candidatus Marithrix sp.]|nr:hypothetical protein [Candidatus Marithrix sp.]